MIIKITGEIIIEKGEVKTAPIQHPIQYNPNFYIKRKYYKKWDPEYHRKPIKKAINPILNSLKQSKSVIQAPLLDLDF